MNVIEQELIAAAQPYWEAEATIVRRFFMSKPTRESHLLWLKAQLWKELHPVDGYFTGLQRELNNLVKNFTKIDRGIARHHYHALMLQLAQEFNHYVLLADIFEYLVGRPITARDTIRLPQEKKLGELRRRFSRSGSQLDRAAVLVTEGGGARMFREGRKVKGGRLERMIAKAMDVIYRDEKDHYQDAAKEAARSIRNARDLKRVRHLIRAVSMQRVLMRNEMFGQPMTNRQIAHCLGKSAMRLKR